MTISGTVLEAMGASLGAAGDALQLSSHPAAQTAGRLMSPLGTYMEVGGELANAGPNASEAAAYQALAGAIGSTAALAALSATVPTATLAGLGVMGAVAVVATIEAGGMAGRGAYNAANAIFDNPYISPLVIDLDRDGNIELTPLLNNSKAAFDFDNDGFREQTGWVQADDALLARDINGDGIINNITELFGNATTDGFIMLSALDSNSDGFINSSDTNFSSLRVWRDLSQEGISSPNELQTLSAVGITSINLNYSTVNTTNQGNLVSTTSLVTFGTSGTSAISDIWFNVDQVNSVYAPAANEVYNIEVFRLPQLRGHGVVADLWSAMSSDASLRTLVSQLTTENYSSFNWSDFRADMQTIVYKWLEVENVSPTSRGAHIDARKLEGLENLLDKEFNGFGSPNPTENTGYALSKQWDKIVDDFSVKMLLQINQLPILNATVDAVEILKAQEDLGVNLSTLTSTQLQGLLDPAFSNIEQDINSHPLVWVTQHSAR